MSYYIGVIGELFNKFESKRIQMYLDSYLNQVIALKEKYEDQDFDDNIYIVTGLIDKGITNIICKIAQNKKWKIIGIDSENAKPYKTPKVDHEKYIEGGFGDENEYFIENIDVLIRIGGEQREKDKNLLAISKNIPVFSKDM